MGVEFTETISYTGNGKITLAMSSGDADMSAFSTSADNRSILFNYTVVYGDSDIDGVSIAAAQISGLTVTDRAGNTGILDNDAMGTQAGQKVDGVRPTIRGLPFIAPDPDGTFTAGDNIRVILTWTEPVTASGTPSIKMRLTQLHDMSYHSQATTTESHFSLTVPSGISLSLIEVPAGSIQLDSDESVVDRVGNPAVLTYLRNTSAASPRHTGAADAGSGHGGGDLLRPRRH